MKSKSSNKTTISGIMVAVMAIMDQCQALLDNDPLTNPDFNIVCAALAAAYGLIKSRDHDVSSKDAGIDKV